jgi:hypothetical protein
MNQEEAINCAFLAAQEEGELWFPVRVAHPGQLENQLVANHWWFCAAWRSTIRFRSRVVSVVISPAGHEPMSPPGDCRNV